MQKSFGRKLKKDELEIVSKVARGEGSFRGDRTTGLIFIPGKELPDDRALEIGDKGRLRAARVIQVVDSSNVLVERKWMIRGYEIRNPGATSGQLLASPSIKEVSEVCWLEIPTEGLVDGRYYDDRTPAAKVLYESELNVIGTKRYETAAGAKTVMHLKLLKK